MFKKLLATLGKVRPATIPSHADWFYEPYAEPHVNFLYNLLFCDDINLFKNDNNVRGDDVWQTVLADQPDLGALRRIADDETNEGRVRALAYNRLRDAGQNVPTKKVLGVIVEVTLSNGLDTLAAFSEGEVRYLNQTGRVGIFEGAGHPVVGLAKELVAASQPVVDQIGPWDKKRLPPPKPGNVRLTFLVSDGLYFGEGAFESIEQDPMGGPVLAKATVLLQSAVEIGSR